MRLTKEFFLRDALVVAPALVGATLVRKTPEGEIIRLRIEETEAYLGEADTACHASKGRTKRTEPLYREGGTLYIYLCYGLHWLMNVVTGAEEDPQCVLIRACEAPFDGPAKLTKRLFIDKAFNTLDVTRTEELWIEEAPPTEIESLPRVGIGYASDEDQAKLWRFQRANRMEAKSV